MSACDPVSGEKGLAAGSDVATCTACPRACTLAEGALGFCRARRNVGGTVVPEAYGRVTSLALDPVEKKPLARFMPGTLVVSAGFYGCNLRCPYCQNASISQVGADGVAWEAVTPEELVSLTCAQRERDARVVGIAYTYNEPLTSWEYVRDCAELAREAGLVNVLVSNGCVTDEVIAQVAPLVDAANIDLKGFSHEAHARVGSDLGAVLATIRTLAAEPGCHLELTTLVVEGITDDEAMMDAEAAWVAALDDDITLHVTRCFPRWQKAGQRPTPLATMHRLADIARRHLPHVYLGNC